MHSSLIITNQSFQAKREECKDGGDVKEVHFVVKDYICEFEFQLLDPALEYPGFRLLLELVIDDSSRTPVPQVKKEPPMSFHLFLNPDDDRVARAECKISALSSQWEKSTFLVAAHGVDASTGAELFAPVYSQPIFVVSKVAQLPGHRVAPRKRSRSQGVAGDGDGEPDARGMPALAACVDEMNRRQKRMLAILQRAHGEDDGALSSSEGDLRSSANFPSLLSSSSSSSLPSSSSLSTIPLPSSSSSSSCSSSSSGSSSVSASSGTSQGQSRRRGDPPALIVDIDAEGEEREDEVLAALRALIGGVRGLPEVERRGALQRAIREVTDEMGDVGDVMALINAANLENSAVMMNDFMDYGQSTLNWDVF